MKRFLLVLAVAAFSLTAAGCRHHNLSRNCGNSGCDRCGGHAGGYAGGHQVPGRLPPGYAQEMGGGGAPTGAYAYPYYTIRGPRDFLLDQPPSIGH